MQTVVMHTPPQPSFRSKVELMLVRCMLVTAQHITYMSTNAHQVLGGSQLPCQPCSPGLAGGQLLGGRSSLGLVFCRFCQGMCQHRPHGLQVLGCALQIRSPVPALLLQAVFCLTQPVLLHTEAS